MISSQRQKRIWVLGVCLALGIVSGLIFGWTQSASLPQWAASPAISPLGLLGGYEKERTDGGYFVFIDDKGQVLDQTSMYVYRGDELISESNLRYRVRSVDGDVARCELLGEEDMTEAAAMIDDYTVPAAAGKAGAADKPIVGIYHTHGGESYVPSQGVESVSGKGGVSEVAQALQSKLKSQGINAIYDSTSHMPNDSGSYRRSRRTAAALMKQGARVLIDIHRDAAPASAYTTEVDGKDVAKVRLVVGRQNPQESSALGLAKRVKSLCDKKYPGLCKSIFMGRGAYNQDLSPTSMLVEVGSQRTTLEQAKKGAELFADNLPKIIGASTTGATRIRTGTDAGGSWKAIGWIIGAFLVGGVGYLLISTGSIKGAAGKIKQFGGSEWSSFLGREPKGTEADKDKTDQYPDNKE